MKANNDEEDSDRLAFLNDRQRKFMLQRGGIRVRKLVIGAGVTAIAVASLELGWREYQQHQQVQQDRSFLQQAQYWKTQKNYKGCLIAVERISANTAIARQAEQLEAECNSDWITQQLQIPQALALAGRFEDAIAAVELIPGDVTDDRISAFVDDCAQHLIQKAERLYRDPAGRLEEALSTLRAVSVNSQFYQETLDRSQQWQAEWQDNQMQLQSAEVAVQIGDFKTAQTALRQISDHPFWQPRVNALVQQVATQQQYYRSLLAQAHQFVAQGNLQNATAIISNLPQGSLWREQGEQILTQVQPPVQPVRPVADLSLNQEIRPIGRGKLKLITLFIFLVSLFLAIDQRRYR